MQASSKRVKSIYSVIASPNRLEILKILNTKGPLSYSELKTLAGFKSKKESGKFAYHLRKLVRQALISLNRAERKYTVTNLGRVILNLTRQIEEQSMLESGKLYVRTSRQTIEELNSDKILQSLVREAGMPVELAQKITSETETRLYKFQTAYLTAPLIREMVNALLIEHGYEEYRHKLTRLGLPVYDVTESVNRASSTAEGIEAVMMQMAHSVFSEYSLLAQLSRDVADGHLAGDVHISRIGCWGLMPDTIFIDLASTLTDGVNLDGKLSTTPRVLAPKDLEEAAYALITLASLTSREATTEVSLLNFLEYFVKYDQRKDVDELSRVFRRVFQLIPAAMTQGYSRPIISIFLNETGSKGSPLTKLAIAAFEAYKRYVESVPVPLIKLIVTLGPGADLDFVKPIAQIARSGGCLAISTQPDQVHSYMGLRRGLSLEDQNSVSVLHSLSLNLPRLAYKSNKDETYFRAELALLLQTSVDALSSRRRMIDDMIRRGLLPVLAYSSNAAITGNMPLVLNMIGLSESVSALIGERAPPSSRRDLYKKIVETALKVTAVKSEKIGERAGTAIIGDESAFRFAMLDAEKYGKWMGMQREGGVAYSQTPLLQVSDLEDQDLIRELGWFSQALNGGYSVMVEVPRHATVRQIEDIVTKANSKVSFFKLYSKVAVCRNCGSKAFTESNRCSACGLSSPLHYYTS